MSGSAFCLLPSAFKVVPAVGIAPTSPRLQRGANLPQLLGELVVPAGNAPASSGYQPGALLLSYETMAEGVGNAPTSAQMAARVGLAPTPCGLTNRRATLTPPGNGAAGRTPTCMVPFRRRMPHVFGHGSSSNWSARQDLHLRSLGPKPNALAATLRADWRTRRELHPQPSRRQRDALLIELRVRNGGKRW